jgi:hypothetical protein
VTAFPALAVRIRQELVDLRRCVDRALALMTKASARGDLDYLDGVALNLHAFYTGVEHVLEAVAREVDGSVPGGPEWHRDLLLQLSGEIAGVRPAVLSEATRRRLDAYRGFRHVVRNVYGYNLDPDRVRQLAGELPACYDAVLADLDRLAAFLDALG